MLAAGVKPNETTFRALLFSVNIAKEPDSLPVRRGRGGRKGRGGSLVINFSFLFLFSPFLQYIVEEMRKHIEFTETLYYNVLASTTVGDHQSLAESLLDQV